MPYVCIQEGDGLWAVWDDVANLPAKLDGKPLIGLPKTRAETLRKLLRQIDSGITERRSLGR
jgi:hypothetical protein